MAVWDNDRTVYFPCPDVKTPHTNPPSNIYNYNFRCINGQGYGCYWNDNTDFGITGTYIDEMDDQNLENEDLSGGLLIKKNGVPVFYVSPLGDLRFAKRMFTNTAL